METQTADEIYDEFGRRSIERLFLGSKEDSSEQVTLSVGQSEVGCKGAWDIAGPAYLRALIADKPRISAMVQDAVVSDDPR